MPAKIVLLTALLAAATVPAHAQTDAPHSGMAMVPGDHAPSDHAPGDHAMMDSMSKMNRAMSNAPMTGDPDHDFVAMMIPHHQGAVDMAKLELQHGRDPDLRKLARAVIAAQNREIAFMKRWLANHPAK